MSGLTGTTRAILRLADRLAGPERREWLTAMAAETDAAGTASTGWALGCLGAVLRDRVRREAWFLLALAILPPASILVMAMTGLGLSIVARYLGLPMPALVPVMLLGPLPVAWLLGRMRPALSPLFTGTLGYLLHQAPVMVAMSAMTGRMPQLWGPNVTWYMLPAPVGLALGWLLWVAGAWLGSRVGRRAAVRA